MPEKESKETKKHPSEMTTDEAIDYVFGNEIADELRRQAGKVEKPEPANPRTNLNSLDKHADTILFLLTLRHVDTYR
jgi:hypothetical protein